MVRLVIYISINTISLNDFYIGCASLWLIILIGYDRYNVIVNGFSGTKITAGKAALMIIFAFTYSTATVLPPLLGVWGKYSLGKKITDFQFLQVIVYVVMYCSYSYAFTLCIILVNACRRIAEYMFI